VANRLPSAPPVLSGFSYVRPLGTGGFADVFLFEQDMPRRPVAVKVLLQDVVDEGLLRMFNAEADIMARLSAHPSILTIYEASVSADGRPYLVMEYCPGSLATRYRREQIPLGEVLQTGIRIASALETVHRAKLLHRDVKPSNILITQFGAPVLSDFGIAAAVAGAPDDELFAMSIPWSAPEVVGERVSGSIAAEVWSLGATVYTLLAGRSPFERSGEGQNTRERMRARIRRARYTPLGRPDVPEELEAILARAMSREPEERYSSALDLARELQRVQHALGMPVTATEVAADEWAAPATPVDFNDGRLRGPVRSQVSYPSRRRAMRRRAASVRAPEEGTAVEAGRARAGLPLVLILAAAAVVAVGAAVTAALILGLGR